VKWTKNIETLPYTSTSIT